MATPVDSIAQFIATDLALGTLGGTVFEDSMPDASDGSLDTCIAVYSLPGAAPTLTQGDDTDSPSFQVACRAVDAGVAVAHDQAIFQALHGLTETTVHGTHFKLIAAAQSGPTPLGRDDRQRNLYVRAYRALVSGVSR